MTLSEIQALPVQTNNRLRYATDAQQLFVVLRGSDGSAAIPVGVGTNNTITVADTTARKTLTSYDATGGPVPGTTQVVQANLPGILWSLVADDVTADASWIGQPYTVDPDGDIVVNMELADISTTVADQGVIGRRGGLVGIGDGATPGGIAMMPSSKPDGYLRIVAIPEAVPFAFSVTHNGLDGAAGITMREEGESALFSASDGNDTTAFSPPHRSCTPYEIWAFPSAALNLGKSGEITKVTAGGNLGCDILELDLAGLSQLTFISVFGDKLKHLDFTGTALLHLILTGYAGSLLDLDPVAATLGNIKVTSANVVGKVNLTADRLTTYNSAGLGGALEFKYCPYVTELDISGLNLTDLDAAGNSSMEKITATGCVLTYKGFGSNGSSVSGGNLSFQALLDFLDSLGVTTVGGNIKYGNNPGAAEFEAHLIANPGETKGYTWYNQS